MPYKDPEKRKKWFEKNKKRIYKQQSAYQKSVKHKPRVKSRTAIRSSKDSANRRGGLPCTDSVDTLIAAMTGFCHICGKGEGDKDLCMDHDHLTGKFRGWLCHKCNRGLGHFNDDTSVLKKAIDYLDAP